MQVFACFLTLPKCFSCANATCAAGSLVGGSFRYGYDNKTIRLCFRFKPGYLDETAIDYCALQIHSYVMSSSQKRRVTI